MDIILSDIRNVAESIFMDSSMTYIAMVVVAILIAVMSMRNLTQILCISFMAMVVLAIIWLVYGGATSAAPTDPATWISQLQAGWASMAQTTGSTMVGYLVTFAAVIIVLFLGKSLIFRG